MCRECHGSGLCEHKNQKGRCTLCPIDSITSSSICRICKMTYAKNGVCAMCRTVESTRIERVFGNMIIEHVGHPPNSRDKSMVNTSVCGDLERRRPDLLWIVPGERAVVVEIDEDSHVSRESSCEARKISEQNLAIHCHPVITFRVNPGPCDTSESSLEERAAVVGALVKKMIREGDRTEIFFCYYHSKSARHIEEHMKTWICTIISC